MKDIGKVKIIASDFCWIDEGEILQAVEYEVGDELSESGERVEEKGAHYMVYSNHGNVDLEFRDIEFIEEKQ